MEHHKPIGREFTPLCYRHPGLDSSMAAGFADGRSLVELSEIAGAGVGIESDRQAHPATNMR